MSKNAKSSTIIIAVIGACLQLFKIWLALHALHPAVLMKAALTSAQGKLSPLPSTQSVIALWICYWIGEWSTARIRAESMWYVINDVCFLFGLQILAFLRLVLPHAGYFCFFVSLFILRG